MHEAAEFAGVAGLVAAIGLPQAIRLARSRLASAGRRVRIGSELDTEAGTRRERGEEFAMNEARWSLYSGLRRLWADHVIWTRQYVLAAVAGTPDAEAAAGRLLKNQEDIGNAIVPLYGKKAGAALTDLLKQHILIAVDLIEAAKAGDDPAFEEHDARWSANVDKIATFLSEANPNWPKKDVLDLLNQHLALTKGEVVARLSANYADDVQAFDDIFTEILTLSDALADGIVKQFPDKF